MAKPTPELHFINDENGNLCHARKCNSCGEIKVLEEFSLNSFGAFGRASQCRSCYNDKKRNRPNNPELNKHNSLSKHYGIGLEDYKKLYNEQEGKCKICQEYFDILDVDHCHTSNKIRGLLCSTCNSGLGMFKDNIELLKIAIKYLEEKL